MAAAALLALCFVAWGAAADAKGPLLHVSLLYRHGDRSPLATFPNDQLGASAWPQGFGELTKRGVQQQFELGRFLRQRYKDFISASYVPSEISVRSSAFNRTIQSAYSCLAGFYNTSANPEGANVSSNSVPVFFVPKKDDALLGLAPCPSRETARGDVEKTEEMQAFLRKHPRFAASVCALAGYKDSSFKNLATIYDSLYCQEQHGFPMPSWANWTNLTDASNKTAMGLLDEMADLTFTLLTRGRTVKRLSAGLLIGEIARNMKNCTAGKHCTKLAMYSAHDSTVTSLLSALDVFDGQMPQYAAVVMLELSMENDQPTVNIYYKNGPGANEAVLQDLPGCKAPCTLARFGGLVAELVPLDYAAECRLVSTHTSQTDGGVSGIVIAIAVSASMACLIILGSIIFCCCRRPRHKHLTERSKSWRAQRCPSSETSTMLKS